MRTEDLEGVLTAAYKAQVQSRRIAYRDSEFIQPCIKQVSEWLTNENAKMGMFFTGSCGTGKSTMIKAIELVISWFYKGRYLAPTLTTIKATELAALALNKREMFEELTHRTIIAIDDLGQEPAEINNYGNVIKPCIDFLSARYDNQLMTIISSNLIPKDIRDYYDDRLADRFKEMMEVVYFGRDSFRNNT